MQFRDQVIILTGGASDIGQALIKELLRQKGKVIIFDIDRIELNNIVEEYNNKDCILETEIVDMTDSKLVEMAIEKIYKKYGRIDYVFNIVGISMVGETCDMNVQDWQEIININLLGILYPTVHVYKKMVAQGFGHIINMSSLGGIIPSPFNVAYATTKYGIVGLSTSLSVEAKSRGVNITVVCAGGIKTKLWDSVRLINMNKDKFRLLVPDNTLISPDAAAKIILKGIYKKKSIIIFPLFAKVSFFIYQYLPALYSSLIKISLKGLNSAQKS